MKKYFKEGQTVYSASFGKGVVSKIHNDNSNPYPIEVTFLSGNIEDFTLDGKYESKEQVTLSQNPIMPIANKPLDDNYVPFTFEDRELFRGKWVKNKNTQFEYVIDSIDKDGITFFNYQELFDNFTFLDGSPCGKLV